MLKINEKFIRFDLDFDRQGKHSLITGNINAILNVLRCRFEEFRSVYIAAEENAATNASTASRFIAILPQKPNFLVSFVVRFEKTETN